ncbi:MAG: Uma2 family endonuclease [Salinibacter sp.]
MPNVKDRIKDHQLRWDEIVSDPALRDLPYTVETNARGQIILSPHQAHHAELQGALLDLLRKHVPKGRGIPEYPLATSEGVKQADVVWVSEGRLEEMRATGDPPTLASEICVEVMSESNTEEEMQAKRRLYREIGADEVWVVSEEGDIRLFGEEEQECSEIAPECPRSVQL